MLATLTPRKPAWIVARGAMRLRRCTRPKISTDAFGQALGNSIAEGMAPSNTPQEKFRAEEIGKQNAQAKSDALYGWSNGSDGLGFKAFGGTGLSYGGVRQTPDDTRIVRDFDPENKWNPDALVPTGMDGRPTAQVGFLINPATMGGAVGGGYQPIRPNGAGGPPGYDIRTDMPTGTPGYSRADPSFGLGAPPQQVETHSWKDFLMGGLPPVPRALVNALDSLVFKSDSEKLSDSLKAAGYMRPTDTDAHHIVPTNAGKLDDVRAKLESFGIGGNDAANGVYLPGVRGSEAEGAYHRRLHSNDYYDQLREDFRGVNSRQRALDTLNDIRGQLLDGTYPGSKPVPPKKP